MTDCREYQNQVHRLYCHRCHHRELEHILEVVLILQNSSRKLNMVAEN